MTGWPRLPSPAFDIDPENGPRSNLFNDGYASPAGAASETETVFLGGIGAPEAWRDRQRFAIGETGFGLGLNFLMTWDLWRRTAPATACLHYVSVEGYPLDRSSLARALDLYRDVPNLAPLIDALCRVFPIRHAGFHRLSLDGGRVQLTLLFGPVEKMLSQLTGRMDAWYLDGFAPSRNRDMWSAEVFAAIARRTRLGGRLATYTAAGFVRRGLEEAGFAVEKQPGYAHKRERLTGKLTATPEAPQSTVPWFDPPSPAEAGEVAIIGGSIAASCCWLALRSRGVNARLFDRLGDLGGMGENPAAMLSPKLTVGPGLSGRLNALAFLKALAFYVGLGDAVWHPPRGLSQIAPDDEEIQRQARLIDALGWPEDIMALAPSCEPPSLTFSLSGCLNPQAVARAIGAPIETACIEGLQQTIEGWRLLDETGKEIWSGPTVIVAAGGWTGKLLQAPWLGIRPSRGQVSWVNDDALGAGLPEQGTGFYGGYLTPRLRLPDGREGRVLGSSFDPWRDPAGDTSWQAWSLEDHRRYATDFAAAFDRSAPDAQTGWTGLRAMTADRLPVAGPVPDASAYRDDYADLRHGRPRTLYPPARYRKGLYVVSGFGARGYQFAPLMADLLADMMTDAPLPLERDLVHAVHPARFLVRDLKRAGTVTSD